MSDYLSLLYGALRTSIVRAWPDTVTCLEAEQSSLVPWADLNSDLPYAVIVVNSLASSPDFGMCNQAYLAQVDVYRVQAVGGPAGTLFTQLAALRDDLHNTALTYGQVWPDPEALAWHDGLEPNRVFASKGMLMRAGRLSVSIVVGDAAS